MLRRKPAAAAAATAATAAASVDPSSNSFSAAKDAKHNGGCRSSSSSTSGTVASSSRQMSETNKLTSVTSHGGAGVAFCLIPQPFHDSHGKATTGSHGNGSTCNQRSGGDASSSLAGSHQDKSHSRSSGSPGDRTRGYGAGGGGTGEALAPQTQGLSHKRKADSTVDLGCTFELDRRCSNDQTMSAECRLERNREQNRQSSRKARMRRKSEEVSLKEQIENMEIFREIVEEGPDMMSIHGLDHRAPFRYASSAYQRIAGMNPREVLGLSLTDLIVPEDHAIVQAVLLKIVLSHASDDVVSYRMLTPHGRSMAIETSIRMGDNCLICVSRVIEHGDNIAHDSNSINNAYGQRNLPEHDEYSVGGRGTAGGENAGAGAAVICARQGGGGRRVREASSGTEYLSSVNTTVKTRAGMDMNVAKLHRFEGAQPCGSPTMIGK